MTEDEPTTQTPLGELALAPIRRAVPSCTGLAWLAGDPLVLVASSGAPSAGSWDAIVKTAPALLRDGPLASPEVLMRTADELVLITEREGGVAVVAIAGTSGVALVQARMLAAKLRPA